MSVDVPAARPCGSCPYRCDVPSGVWDDDEYAKLPRYDGPTGEQDPSVFLCHLSPARLCAGWAGCHDMHESLGLRIAVQVGVILPADVDRILDYRTDVLLFPSGQAAAEHGLRDLEAPGLAAAAVIRKLRPRLYPDPRRRTP